MIEYKIIPLTKSLDKIENELSFLSAEGWRLVCPCGKHNRHLILKRKVREKRHEEDYD